jgi:hypothetical protein
MTEVSWSSVVHVYSPESRLGDLLGDIKRLADAPRAPEVAYLAIRFEEEDWYVLPVHAASHLLRSLGSYNVESRFRARLSDVATQLKSQFGHAFVLAPGRSRAVTLGPRPPSGAWYAIELDPSGKPLRVGELAAIQSAADSVPEPAPTRSRSRSIRPSNAEAERIQVEPQKQLRQQDQSPPIARPTSVEFTWPQPPGAPEAAAAEPRPARSRRLRSPAQPPADTVADAGPRYIQGDLFRKAGEKWLPSEADLAVDHKYRFDVFIGPPGLGSIQADTAFRDDALDWSRADVYTLQVVFAEIGRDADAQSRNIELPRTGKSSVCSFIFSPSRLGVFRARISVLHEGRVLQTAVVETAVEPLPRARRSPGESPALRPQVEMVVRHDMSSLGDRQHFDASLILNHANDGAAAMTAAAKDGAYVASLDDLQAQLASISTLLVELATKSKVHTKGLTTKENAAWLGRLAAEGHFLHRKLVADYINKSPAADALNKAEHLQIVSARPDSVVPLEFVYEYPPPKKGAPVCENALQALQEGRCPASCKPKRSPAACVCPMGFWGLSRVIERHVHDPDLPKPAKIIAVEPTSDRGSLEVRGASLLAISEQVKAAEQKKLAARIKQHWKGGVSIAENWEAWPDTVAAQKPVLFVVLPHTKGKGAEIALEIHGDALESRYIERSYVYPEDSSTSPPIVLLLGCDTSNTADKDAYTTNIAVFRQAGSAIVLATTAALIWGDDSAKVAGQIVEAFDAAVSDTPQRFGDILRTAKRRSVADSQLMAMCLAAFGDADWRLSVKPGA